MIENVTWYLGGHSTDSATAEAFYGYERGDSVYSGRPTSWEGQIGLMYPSDFGYSVLASSCARTTNLDDYSTATCGAQSWLYGVGDEHILTPHSSKNDTVFCITPGGSGSYSDHFNGKITRPVLYLDSNVFVYDGNGSISDPYIIGM